MLASTGLTWQLTMKREGTREECASSMAHEAGMVICPPILSTRLAHLRQLQYVGADANKAVEVN